MVPARAAESLAWMRTDALIRLVPFAAVCAIAVALWRPRWLGLSWGRPEAQILFGLLGLPVLLGGATAVQLWISRQRGWMAVPSAAGALLQAGYFLANAPIEEAFFRGLIQGGLGAATALPAIAFAAATAVYVLYHRLGGWGWESVTATVLAGVPFGLAFWLLPGPPSILGVSIAHVGATCGFLGPGAYLMRRLRIA